MVDDRYGTDVLASGWRGHGRTESSRVPAERGLVVELAEGLWLHEAMRERLLREVGEAMDERKAKLEAASS